MNKVTILKKQKRSFLENSKLGVPAAIYNKSSNGSVSKNAFNTSDKINKIQHLKQNIEPIIKGIEWAVFTVLTVLILILLAPFLPTKEQFSTYTIASGSMSPTIPTGSVVFTAHETPKNIKVGDVIAFTSPENSKLTIVHRIVDTQNGAYVTKGDNNNAKDNWLVPLDQVKGKIVFHMPYIGNLSAKVNTPQGFGLLIGVPALLLALFQVKKIYEGIEEEIQKRTKAAISNYTQNTRATGLRQINSII